MSELQDSESVEPKTEDRLVALAAELGFKELQDLVESRKALNSTKTFDEFRSGLVKYQETAEAVVDRLDDNERPKGQIGLILVTASIYYSKEMFSDSSNAVKDAMEYAYQMRDDELVRKIADLWFADPKYTYKRRF